MSMSSRRMQTLLAMHGSIILLLGLLSGIGFSYAAAVGDRSSALYDTWRFAHAEGLMNGMLVLIIAAVWHLFESQTKWLSGAACLLVWGCYCNIIGPIITALFIGHRVIEPTTALESFVVYGFYIPGTLPLFSVMFFVYYFYRSSRAA